MLTLHWPISLPARRPRPPTRRRQQPPLLFRAPTRPPHPHPVDRSRWQNQALPCQIYNQQLAPITKAPLRWLQTRALRSTLRPQQRPLTRPQVSPAATLITRIRNTSLCTPTRTITTNKASTRRQVNITWRTPATTTEVIIIST